MRNRRQNFKVFIFQRPSVSLRAHQQSFEQRRNLFPIVAVASDFYFGCNRAVELFNKPISGVACRQKADQNVIDGVPLSFPAQWDPKLGIHVT